MSITPLVDFFPFNMESGPSFLVFYAAFAFVSLNLLRLSRNLLGRLLDDRAGVGLAGRRTGHRPGAPGRRLSGRGLPPRGESGCGQHPHLRSHGRRLARSAERRARRNSPCR